MKRPTPGPPLDLLSAFKALETAADIAVLLIDDGFDAILVRVLGAWEKAANKWTRPTRPMPDDGQPTAAAWDWMMSGCWHDLESIARGANISRDQARDRVAVLVQARLIYPDGSMSKYARQAITATVQMRLKAAGAGKKKKDEPQAN